MEITGSKIAATVVGLGCVVAFAIAVMGRQVPEVAKASLGFLAWLIVSLGLIWFPEEIGGITGYVGHGRTIDSETPAPIVSFFGWLFLVLGGLSALAQLFG
jgi:hypothetical protein